MPALVWDQIGDRFYETGISKGVLYKEDGFGVVWNGITAVEENFPAEVESVYYDGVKFNDIVTIGDFSAVLRALTYPDEFLYYEGTLADQRGFYITGQPQNRFCLSYQTEIGNDVDGLDKGYKIHILYGLTAIPSSREYESINSDLEPVEFEWSITSVPEDLENYRATSCVILDSRKVDPLLLKDIEDVLYGTEEVPARLPPLQGFVAFINRWNRLIIDVYSDGTWTATANDEGILSMLDETTFQIVSDTAEYINADTYTVSSSEKNEDDIWLP